MARRGNCAASAAGMAGTCDERLATCDTREQAIAWLDEELDRTLDKMRHDMADANIPEDMQDAALQLVFTHMDKARERGLARSTRRLRALSVGHCIEHRAARLSADLRSPRRSPARSRPRAAP